MKLQITLLTSALILALPALAKEVPLNQAAAIAGSVTPAAASPAFDDLEGQTLAQLRALQPGQTFALFDEPQDAWMQWAPKIVLEQ